MISALESQCCSLVSSALARDIVVLHEHAAAVINDRKVGLYDFLDALPEPFVARLKEDAGPRC
jgi:hypothetical protein